MDAKGYLAALRRMPEASRKRVIAAISDECGAKSEKGEIPQLLTDEELAGILRINVATLRLHARKGPPKRHRRDVIDVRMIRNIKVGGSRRWVRQSVINTVNGTNE